MEKYFAVEEHNLNNGATFSLGLRAELAFRLITHFGTIAAKVEGEDSAGRAKLELQSAEELVERAFAISNTFIAKAESLGEIKKISLSIDELATRQGELARIRMDREFKREPTAAK